MDKKWPKEFEPIRSWVGWKTLKREIYRYCCGYREDNTTRINVFSLNTEKIIPELMPIWKAFEKHGFNLDKFMTENGFELIEDEEIRLEILMSVCFPLIHQPISKFMVDWLNGYLDFFKRNSDLRWENGSEITDTEILRRLFYCRTEEEIWQLMGKGIGSIQDLYAWYKGQDLSPILAEVTGISRHCEKDEDKAERMLNYFLESPDVTKKVHLEVESIIRMNTKAIDITLDSTDLIEEIKNEFTRLEARIDETNVDNN